MNKFSLQGEVRNLSRIDPKPGAKYELGAKWLLKVPHERGERCDNLPMSAWNKEASAVLDAGEGATVLCTGRIGRRTWEKTDGTRQYETTLTCSNVVKVATTPSASEVGF